MTARKGGYDGNTQVWLSVHTIFMSLITYYRCLQASLFYYSQFLSYSLVYCVFMHVCNAIHMFGYEMFYIDQLPFIGLLVLHALYIYIEAIMLSLLHYHVTFGITCMYSEWLYKLMIILLLK